MVDNKWLKKTGFLRAFELTYLAGRKQRRLAFETQRESVYTSHIVKGRERRTKCIPYSFPGLEPAIKQPSKWPKALVGQILVPLPQIVPCCSVSLPGTEMSWRNGSLSAAMETWSWVGCARSTGHQWPYCYAKRWWHKDIPGQPGC